MGNNILDSVESKSYANIFTPYRLVSLLDMIRTTLDAAVDGLECAESALKNGVAKTPNGQKLDKQQQGAIRENLATLEKHLVAYKFQQPHQQLKKILAKVDDPTNQVPIYSYSEYEKDAYSLGQSIETALEATVFGFIPAENAVYFQNDKLFGEDVYIKFPSAREEIMDAGTSYAYDLNTACVFHLMRTVEIGAKVMVSAMKAQKHITTTVPAVTGGRRTVKKPIELCDWSTLIKGLETALRHLEAGTKTSVKKKDVLAFYSHALGQFRNFKDAWRNNVAHGNKKYQRGETRDIMENARKFMQHLALRIKE